MQHLETFRLPEELWDEVPKACHRVDPGEEILVAEKLLATGVAVLVPEALFAVAKAADQDRLIFDRRPENFAMASLDWGVLPNAACLARVLLKPDEYLRGSGNDLKNFYYNLRLPDNWIRFNSIGRRVPQDLAERYGMDRQTACRLCLRVLGVGDKNGVAIAQATHEAILKSHDLLDPQEVLLFGKPSPKTSAWQGVYIDDLLITHKVKAESSVPLDGSFVPPLPVQADDPDVKLVHVAEEAYEKASLEGALRIKPSAMRLTSEHGVPRSMVFKIIQGHAGAPMDMRRQVWLLIATIVKSGWSTKAILQKIVGYTAFIFSFRRELYCLHHRLCLFLAGMDPEKWNFLPA